MSARIEGIACPMCHTVLSLEQITQQLDNEHAFAHLLALSVPLPHQVMQYMTLFTPPLQGLTLRKKLRIVKQLLPDMRRETVTHGGARLARTPGGLGAGIRANAGIAQRRAT